MRDEVAQGGGRVPASSIALRGASKLYGSHVAVHPLELRIEPGEFMTFLGPSGSGKTTTLNLIAGFTELSAGEVEIGGVAVSHVPAHRRGIGVVFQQYALFPHMSVHANVEFPLKRRRVSKQRRGEMVAHALATVRLEGYERRYPSELSGGEQQRVALARALVFEPEVLLMDEPLGALDRKLREWLQVEIKRIHREVKTTFVYVTHDQDEALALSDRIAVFNQGRVEQVATPEVLYQQPETLFVGQFVGESTVLRGPLMERDGATTLRFHDHAVQVPGVPTNAEGSAAVLVRPEALTLTPLDTPPTPGHNALPVRVVERSYSGAEWKYQVLLPGGELGLVREAHTHEPSFSTGAEASLTWAPESGVLLR